MGERESEREKEREREREREEKYNSVWGGSKGVINCPWIFYAMREFSPCWALPEYIRALIYLACLRVFSVTPWVIVY